MGAYEDLWGRIGIYWHLRGPMGASEDQWGPLGTHGDP